MLVTHSVKQMLAGESISRASAEFTISLSVSHTLCLFTYGQLHQFIIYFRYKFDLIVTAFIINTNRFFIRFVADMYVYIVNFGGINPFTCTFVSTAFLK